MVCLGSSTSKETKFAKVHCYWNEPMKDDPLYGNMSIDTADAPSKPPSYGYIHRNMATAYLNAFQ